MSALFKAEPDNLQRLVAIHAAEQAQDTNERERARLGINRQRRTKHLHTIARRGYAINRKAVLAWINKHTSVDNTASANRASEGTGINDETVRKHLKIMADEGAIICIATPGSNRLKYHAKGKL